MLSLLAPPLKMSVPPPPNSPSLPSPPLNNTGIVTLALTAATSLPAPRSSTTEVTSSLRQSTLCESGLSTQSGPPPSETPPKRVKRMMGAGVEAGDLVDAGLRRCR